MNKQTQKFKAIFVGSFLAQAKDGSVGGQMYACRTLVQSPISDYVDWLTIDSTMESQPPPSMARRMFLAGRRVLIFCGYLLRPGVDGALIFTADGPSFYEKGLMAILAYYRGKRVVICPRSGYFLGDLERSRFMRRFATFVFKRCNKVMCQGNNWKELFRSVSGLDENRFKVVMNWIETKPYTNLNSASEEDKTTVLFMGSIIKEKGLFDLVEAVDRFRDGLKDAKFVICGKGDQLESLVAMVKEKRLTGLFEFPGWVSGEKKEEMMGRADILVLPSHAEGMPNVIMEAMAAGKAVIASRVGGIPDLVPDESMGLLFEARDIDGLGRALFELIGDKSLRQSIGREAKNHIVENHDIKNVWPRVLSIVMGKEKSCAA